MSRRTLVPIGLTLSLLMESGCRLAALDSLARDSRVPVAPPTPLAIVTGGHGFYPLDVGNRWNYARTFDVRWVDASGAPQSFHQASTIERELTCEGSAEGRSYTGERTTEVTPGATYVSWLYYRQDRSGLYEADDPASPPCSSPATGGMSVASRAGRLSAIGESGKLPEDAGVRAQVDALQQRLALVRYSLGLPAPSLRRPRPAPGEIVRLAYPLHAGQQWIIRPEPRFTSRVEGVDVLHLPAGTFVAYRIRIDADLFGPNDRVLVWYGREGFLRLDFHGESEGVDEQGNPTGPVVSDDHEIVDGVQLVDAGAN